MSYVSENQKNTVKYQLARLLATENIDVRHSAAIKTAQFDIKNRVLLLPIWYDISDDLYDLLVVHETGHALDTPYEGIEKFLKEIANRVIGNENPSTLRKVMGFVNVVEDARIDKRQKRRYPGSKINYLNGYAELIKRDFFGTKTKDINSMPFIDRFNIYFKGGALMAIQFTPKEMVFINRGENIETWPEALALAEDIFKYSKDQLDQISGDDFDINDVQIVFGDGAPEGDYEEIDLDNLTDEEKEILEKKIEEAIENRKKGDTSEGDGDTGEGDTSEGTETDEGTEGDSTKPGEDEGEGDSDGSSGEDAKGEDAKDGDDADGKAKAGDSANPNEKVDNKPAAKVFAPKKVAPPNVGGKGDTVMTGEANVPQSMTEEAWADRSTRLVKTSSVNSSPQYLDVPDPILENIVDDFPVVLKEHDFKRAESVRLGHTAEGWIKTQRSAFIAWKTKENQNISFMTKEFEMRKAADEYQRTSIAKTGVINTNKIHAYKFVDDIFKRNNIVKEGKNHGFIMFLDWSGSMQSELHNTVKQVLTLTMFCKRVQIPFEVYFFRDSVNTERSTKAQWKKNPKSTNLGIKFDRFKLRNILSSRMKFTELNSAMEALWAMSVIPGDADPLTGTPLNATIVAATKLVTEFKNRNKLQVVNTIFLTDGGSDSIGIDTPTNYSNRNYIYGDYVLNDPITKLQYRTKLGGVMTTNLFNLMKDRCDANLIGFYLIGQSANYILPSYGIANGTDMFKKLNSDYGKNGYVELKNVAGYDTYYLLNPSLFGKKTYGLSKITANSNNAKIAKAFSEVAENKKGSRILLTSFIKEIANETKTTKK